MGPTEAYGTRARLSDVVCLEAASGSTETRHTYGMTEEEID
jgi:hypothetical protein